MGLAVLRQNRFSVGQHLYCIFGFTKSIAITFSGMDYIYPIPQTVIAALPWRWVRTENAQSHVTNIYECSIHTSERKIVRARD